MSVTTTGTPTRPHAAPAPDTVLPVTAAQRSLLFIQEAMERKDLYNISFRITFDGVADESSLRRSLTRLLRVQPALRTEFALDGGVPRARLTEPADVDTETRDVTGRGPPSRPSSTRRAAGSRSSRSTCDGPRSAGSPWSAGSGKAPSSATSTTRSATASP